MKISDFSLEKHNIARPGETPMLEEWETGSRSNIWGIGTLGGQRYQIKIHAAEPKWNLVDQKIRDKKAEIRACDASDDVTLTRLKKELSSLEKNRDKQNERDKDADNYLESKKRLIDEIHNIGSGQLVCPADFWAEPIESKGNGTFAVEAVPWVNGNVGFNGDKPIDFRRDLTLSQQYDVVASLCEQLDKLHKAGILHSDLKIGNTIVSKDSDGLKCTIIDFDSAVVLKDLYSSRYNVNVWYYIIGGTFFAPEMLELFSIARENRDADSFNAFDMRKITTKTDIFSLGVTIYEYFFGEADGANVMPFIGPDGDALDVALYGEAVDQNYKPNLPDTVDELLYAAINWMLAKDPNDRPTAEQLTKVFKNKDLSLIPAKYTRNPLWEEHQGKYKLDLPDGVTLEKGMKPRYKVKNKGVSFNRSLEDLLKMGYLKPIDADGNEIVEEKKEDLSNKAWDADGGMELPPCVRRAAIAGKYMLSTRGVSRSVTFAQLKQAGYICTEAEKATPWPCDKDLKFMGSRPIYRDMSIGKGEGFYVVGTGVSKIRYTTKDLVDKHLASTAIYFALCRDDDVLYTPVFTSIPSNVKSITRNVITNHQYRIEYTDGRMEKIMISEMERRGYVRKK